MCLNFSSWNNLWSADKQRARKEQEFIAETSHSPPTFNIIVLLSFIELRGCLHLQNNEDLVSKLLKHHNDMQRYFSNGITVTENNWALEICWGNEILSWNVSMKTQESSKMMVKWKIPQLQDASE